MKVDASQLLAQLQMAAVQARGETPDAAQAQAPANFPTLLSESIAQVSALQQSSSGLQEAFTLGRPGVSLTDVMIAKGKAGVAFEAMVQVRNKVVEAYQEIMRLQV